MIRYSKFQDKILFTILYIVHFINIYPDSFNIFLYYIKLFENYNKNCKLSKVDLSSFSDSTHITFFVFYLAFNIIWFALVTVFASFWSFLFLLSRSTYSLSFPVHVFFFITQHGLITQHELHIHLIPASSYSCFHVGTCLHARLILVYPWRKIFLNLDLLPKFGIGNNLSKVYIIYYTIILKDKFSSASVALLLYNCMLKKAHVF